MAINPFKTKSAVNLIDAIAAKQDELEDTVVDKASEAAELAQLAAEAKQASKVASQHASAVDAAVNILTKAGVTF